MRKATARSGPRTEQERSNLTAAPTPVPRTTKKYGKAATPKLEYNAPPREEFAETDVKLPLLLRLMGCRLKIGLRDSNGERQPSIIFGDRRGSMLRASNPVKFCDL